MTKNVLNNLFNCTEAELLEALNDAKNDVFFSTGRGVDWVNACFRRKAIIAEAKKRDLLGNKKNKEKK